MSGFPAAAVRANTLPAPRPKSEARLITSGLEVRKHQEHYTLTHTGPQQNQRTILCAFAGKIGLDLHERYAIFSLVVRYSFLRGTLLMPGGYAIVPGRYAVRFWGVRYFFLEGTLLTKT